ncbi:MAG: 4-(cytidine 5'-diphospho)-2-C-methyl-D-erythritol kinase [Chitinophagia bacterium]|nr:4-(cytidine 5'-diphospho)-2-C-methyl-D-erythritol kinase [Chitinophagia bacterium]
MIVFPNCKINLGLHITAKREDGYHNIETIFYPVPFQDLLEVIPAAADQQGLLHQTGLTVEGSPEQNLCIKAYHLLKKDFPSLPAVTTYLHKQIPTGAGLGGGSADGSFMLQLLVRLFDLPVSDEQLSNYALTLGSDCPFFLFNQPVLATGRGEKIQPVAVNLSGWKLILLLPDLRIATAEAFQGCQPRQPATSLAHIIQQPVAQWRNLLINQFEETVFMHHPPLARLKQLLYEQGAVYASMTGTGSTVFGLFPEQADVDDLGPLSGCRVKSMLL